MSERVEWAVRYRSDDEIVKVLDERAARTWAKADEHVEVVCRTFTETPWKPVDPPKESPLDAFLVTRGWLSTVSAHIDWWADDERRASVRALLNRVLANEPHQRSRL